MADGGEGTLDALGGPNRTTTVTGPLGDPVEAAWRLDGRTAVIEMAAASGLELVGGAEAQRPGRGVDRRHRRAHRRGARRGRAPRHRRPGRVGDHRRRARRAPRAAPARPAEGRRAAWSACDSRVPFLDAATVFAPQKGATPAQVELLRRRLERLAQVYLDEHGVDVLALEGAGAAGGLAGGLAAVGAELVSGFDLVADEVEPRRAHRGRRPRDHRRGLPRRAELRGQGRRWGGGARRGGSACRWSRSRGRSTTAAEGRIEACQPGGALR